jgi:hypothetical protein
MKVTIAALTALAVVAAVPTAASAAPAEGYRAYEVKHQYYPKKKYRSYYRSNGRIQYWADKLPIGSQAWWQQMDREQRGGRR